MGSFVVPHQHYVLLSNCEKQVTVPCTSSLITEVVAPLEDSYHSNVRVRIDRCIQE